MSSEFIPIEKQYGFSVTEMSGGKEKGRCYQINEGFQFRSFDSMADDSIICRTGSAMEERWETNLDAEEPNDDPFLETLCSSIVAVVLNITQTIKEHYPMAQLPSPQVKDTGTSTGSHNQNRTGLPYLNSKNQTDFLSVGILTPVVIKACKVNEPGPKVFSAVTARIMFADSRQVLYGLSLKNPNYARLCEMLGMDTDNWVEKKINMTLEKDAFDEKLWVRVEAIPVTKKVA